MVKYIPFSPPIELSVKGVIVEEPNKASDKQFLNHDNELQSRYVIFQDVLGGLRSESTQPLALQKEEGMIIEVDEDSEQE